MKINYSNIVDPVGLLKEKNDNTLNRYDSFNKKISFYLTILTILTTVSIFITGSRLSEIKDIFSNTNFEYKNLDYSCIVIILIVLIIFIYFGSLVFIVINILKALKPITLTEIDFESIDLYCKEEFEKSFDVLINDYKNVIFANQEKMNQKYGLLYKINIGLVFFLLDIFIIVILLTIMVLFI